MFGSIWKKQHFWPILSLFEKYTFWPKMCIFFVDFQQKHVKTPNVVLWLILWVRAIFGCIWPISHSFREINSLLAYLELFVCFLQYHLLVKNELFFYFLFLDFKQKFNKTPEKLEGFLAHLLGQNCSSLHYTISHTFMEKHLIWPNVSCLFWQYA